MLFLYIYKLSKSIKYEYVAQVDENFQELGFDTDFNLTFVDRRVEVVTSLPLRCRRNNECHV